MSHPKSSEHAVRPLRILEIGDDELFVIAVPKQTEFCWTGIKPRGRVARALGPVRMIRSLLGLRRGEFDLLAVHATQYAPWHFRSFLTALRDWNILSPLGLFGIFAWRFVHLFHKVPIAAIDLKDSCQLPHHNFFLLDSCKAYFKRELPSDNWLVFCKSSFPNFPGRTWRRNKRNRGRAEKLKPLSLGPYAVFENTPAPEKTVDVCFFGTVDANSTARVVGFEELKELARQGYVIDISTSGLAWPEYVRRMSGAWLAWSPGGLGWDCRRHYEALLAGSVPLMNYPSIMQYQPLRHGEHCVLYPIEAGGLIQAVRTALTDKPRLRRMAEAGAEHVCKYHSPHARAEYVAATVLGRRLDGSRIDPISESPPDATAHTAST